MNQNSDQSEIFAPLESLEGLAQRKNSNFYLKKEKYDPHLEVQGHRGAGPKHNTLEAFQMAIDFGLDTVELDVWLSNDNQLAVYHGEGDHGLIDYMGGKVQVVSLNMEQIQNLNFYHQKKSQAQTLKVMSDADNCTQQLDQNSSLLSNESLKQQQQNQFLTEEEEQQEQLHIKTRVPSLREVLMLCKDKIRCNIELKGGQDEKLLVYQVLDLVKELEMQDQIELSSFQHRYYDLAVSYINEKKLEQVLEENSEAQQIQEIKYPKFGFLVEFPKDIEQEFIQKFQNQQYNKSVGNTINFPGEFLENENAVENLKTLKNQFGLNLTTWFSYDKKESKEIYDNLRNIGVNCIITNEPELINQYRTFQE
ncbi:PLC-like phosphodiesterase, TIM beta/alpha-barrel domain [Pseudocohnilembus persalinus]|uniref:PLC-like phosphodiesterase, TIM beta/alpha-barrel domain n=1 Tax=Pseudocohnilembus persalinus TaxID=266149 RepID=A0A0V0R8F3_PSEPJ|nr:PLC-like phosphodiesterase, TIM beta/alpha-barrel domain [Pseudocohnilembus persalinus]|eukprot:KRX10656.1 PLC-like phosphodiesterase, TIM beta/alpha-barrel domain [Pseudocohnilembus persalinus]